MKEQISALMDSELNGPDAGLCLTRLKQDPELREAWDLYHLIGDSLRGHVAHTLPRSFTERLAQEPTVLAPRRRIRQRHPKWVALSAAASVAAVAYVGWMALPMLQTPSAQMASAPTAAPAAQISNSGSAAMTPAQVLTTAAPLLPGNAGTNAQSRSAVPMNIIPAGSGMNDYLIAHQRFSPVSAMVGVAPYARSVSQDIGQR